MPDSPPKVLIAGAGLAGLFLAILLERAKIPYQIFERAATVKPLEALMCLNANILPAFEQLGLLDELLAISFPVHSAGFFHGDMRLTADVRIEEDIKKTVPKEKIFFGKKVLSLQRNNLGVMIRIADNTTFHGDILVGADGAYSGVRQSLYKELQKKGMLSTNDGKQLSVNYSTIIGTTNSLGEDYHSQMEGPTSHSSIMIGKGTQYTWSTFTVPENRICWSVYIQQEAKTYGDESFRNSEWSSDTNQGLIKEIRTFKTPYGDLGRLISTTDEDRISRVYVEDKLFETWHHNRTVLIGDAAHKLLVSSGQGAVNALQDAVILANCLYDLTSVTPEGIAAAFQDFRDQRYPHLVAQHQAGKMHSKVMLGQTMWGRIVRRAIYNFLPASARKLYLAKEMSYRPQATFLPQIPNRGTREVLPQKPSCRYAELQNNCAATV